ncbi:hypothetical protein WISP_143587 [Willisornis vidua]|uniref:Uncharacterized protein n=1 Tax=Willisornis vidua TaxID=1566151 RepID=A0ABQ9CRR9_9PASS|nr:hypothetical protein WISP_143587 [Willisornis vidua]
MFKKGMRCDSVNYQPVSLPSVPRKSTEQNLLEAVLRHMEEREVIQDNQRSFTKGKSCLNNSGVFYDGVTTSVEKGRVMDVIYSQYRKDMDLLKQVQRRAREVIGGREHLPYGERVRDLELFSLEKTPGRPYSSLSVLTGGIKERSGQIFSRACCDGTRDNGFQLRVDSNKEKIFYNESGEPLNRFPRKVVDSPSLETFKVQLEGL